MKVKTHDLTGDALNWAVSLALKEKEAKPWHPDPRDGYGSGPVYVTKPYSTDGAQGWPIIERENITIGPNTRPCLSKGNYRYCAYPLHPEGGTTYGPTYLIAAMRCFAASKLGEEVDVPDQLLK